MKISSKRLTDILLYFSVAIFLFGTGYKYSEWKLKKDSRGQSTYTVFNATNQVATDKEENNIDFKLFWDTWEKIEQKYIDKTKVDPQKMYFGAIKGMVASVDDPYTFFLTPEENKQSKDDLGGKFQGIGAQLGLKEGRIVVISPLKDSPAEAAGLKSNDIIIMVDGESSEKWTLMQAVSKIRGPEDTAVVLTVLRGSEKKDISITRKEIKVPSVELSYKALKGKQIAHLQLSQFGDSTNSEWDKAASEIASKYKAGTISGMVLDVRGNPGGYLESAVYIASEFLQKGDLVVTQETTNNSDRVYNVRRIGILQDIPLTILINEGSASASEILSGALRDHKRATLVGEKSFGKGSVQEALDLSEGAGLHVTIAKWLLPEGEWINGKGIEPEIAVTNEVPDGNTITDETDAQLQKALELVIER